MPAHYESQRTIKPVLLPILMALAATWPLAAYPAPVYFAAQGRPLGEVLRDIASLSGIRFRLAQGLEQEKVAVPLTGKDWPEAAQSLLQGYNYAIEWGAQGGWETVTISGKNGSGRHAVVSAERFHTYSRPAAGQLPVRWQGYRAGTVTPITLPLALMKGMKPGKPLDLDLPAGHYRFLHDNRFQHANGDMTWVGYQDDGGRSHRALITLGKQGPMGHIWTTEANYQVISDQGQTYLLDVEAAGLTAGSLLGDQATLSPLRVQPPVEAAGNPANEASRAAANRQSGQGRKADNLSKPSAGQSQAVSTIDLLVLYTKGLEQPEARVHYLTDLTNQAYQDSHIHAKLRVVKLEPVEYGESTSNRQALTDLTQGNGALRKVSALRQKTGADLVSLIRPFHAAQHEGCGIAWVNGSNGGGLSPADGFSVVSDGGDQDGQSVYCGEHTLAHEIGHNQGNVHDREFSDIAGAFDYAYAWGVEGSFGTIMSYRRPTVLLFASPQLDDECKGQPCGIAEGEPDAADNVSTINQTAPAIARFLPTVANP